VIGGGVGGVSAALALRQAGVEVAVFERSGDLRRIQVGGGVHLWNNAMRALDELGLAGAVEAAGHPGVHSMKWYSAKGDVIGVGDVSELTRALGVPSVGLTRSALQSTLVDALGEDAVQLGQECTGFETGDSSVAVRFADGREEHADLLVGADGLHSVVRTQLLGATRPRYAGVKVYQAVVELPPGILEPDVYGLIWGRGGRLGFYPIKGATFWFATLLAPEGEAAAPIDPKQAVLERVRQWGKTALSLVEATPREAITVADIVARPPVDAWGSGRVTLLGDAAHPMTPFLGQGACQAIEDAAVLGRSVRAEPSTAGALRRYEQARIPRTAQIVNLSWRIGRPGRMEHRLACAVRDRVFRVLFPRVIWKGTRKMILTDFFAEGDHSTRP
jgi:FAD-dependent urate hydroxylase